MRDLFKQLLRNANSIYIINGVAAIAAVIGVWMIISSNVPAERDHEHTPQVANEMAAMQSRMEELLVQLQSQPEDAHLNIQMGNVLFDMRRYSDAAPYYSKALRIAPDHTEVRIDLGVCYFNMQMPDSAIVSMQRALAVNPTHVKGLFNLGVIYYNINQMDNAEVQWRKVIELHGDSPEAEMANKLLLKIKS